MRQSHPYLLPSPGLDEVEGPDAIVDRAGSRGAPGPGRRRRVARAAAFYAGTFAILLVLNFFLPRLLPGDPIRALADPGAAGYVQDAGQRAKLEAYYGLNRPLGDQFVRYLSQLARGDLGTSIQTQEPVLTVIAQRLPWTLLLIASGLALSSLVGVTAGIHSGWRRGCSSDRALLVVVLLARNLPAFFVGTLLLLLFAVTLGWLPLSGATTPFTTMAPLERVGDVISHLVLPAVTLALSLLGSQYLLMRNSMVAELGQGYLLLGRAKGLTGRRLKYRHAARNALLPVVTQMTLELGLAGAAVTNVLLVERVFAYPGVGRLVFDSVASRDYPTIAGSFLVLSVMVLAANMVLDVTYARLDPRTVEAR